MSRGQALGGFTLRFVLIVLVFAILLSGVLFARIVSSSADLISAQRNIALLGERAFQSTLHYVDRTEEVGFILTSGKTDGQGELQSFLDNDLCQGNLFNVPKACAWRLRREYLFGPEKSYNVYEDEWFSSVLTANFRVGDTTRRSLLPAYEGDATPIEFYYEQGGRLS